MSTKTGRNHGGKRPGSGRKRNPPWLSLWWSGFRSGDLAMMRRADALQAEAEAREQAPVSKSPPVSDPGRSMARVTANLRGSSSHAGAPGVDQRQQRQRARAARKQRAYRARQEAGVIVLRVAVIENDLAAAMIDEGYLSPDEAVDRGRVEQVLGDLIEEWTRRCRTQPCDFM